MANRAYEHTSNHVYLPGVGCSCCSAQIRTQRLRPGEWVNVGIEPSALLSVTVGIRRKPPNCTEEEAGPSVYSLNAGFLICLFLILRITNHKGYPGVHKFSTCVTLEYTIWQIKVIGDSKFGTHLCHLVTFSCCVNLRRATLNGSYEGFPTHKAFPCMRPHA